MRVKENVKMIEATLSIEQAFASATRQHQKGNYQEAEVLHKKYYPVFYVLHCGIISIIKKLVNILS